MENTQITRELAEELDMLRLTIYNEYPEIETALAQWMSKAGFRENFGMEWLPELTN